MAIPGRRAAPAMRAATAVSGALLLATSVLVLVQDGALAGVAWLWFALQVAPVAAVALVLARHRPDSTVARWLLLCGAALCTGTVAESLLYRSATWPEAPVALLQVLQLLGLTVAVAAVAALLAIFPSGRPDTTAARWLLRAALPSALLATAVLVLSRTTWEFAEIAVWRPLPDRFPLHVDALAGLRPWGTALYNSPALLLTAGLVLLYRRRTRVAPTLRPAVRAVWRTSMAATVASFALMGLAGAGVISEATAAAIPCMFLIPLGMGIAALRDDAFDLDLLVRRTLLHGGASLAITVAVAGAAALLGLTASSRLPLAAAVVVAVIATLALGPVRRRLEASAGRWAFGQRVGGHDVMTQVGQALEHAYDLDELAPRLADMVREGLGVRWAQVLVALDPALPDVLECLGRSGPTGEGPVVRSLPLVHAGVAVGRLECGDRLDGVLTPQDDAVLADLARQAALALHNARLAAELAGRLAEIKVQAAELAASRARLVSAQEVERRRLERDLHDGAQQEIVALMAKLRLARNRLARGDEAGLDGLLDEVQGDARGLLDELRELAHGIRPPVLADRGLVGAIESRAARLPLDVRIDADAEVRAARYDDDIEGAAWFVVSELCANALKHSGGQQLVIAVAESHGQLVVSVADDGCGIPEQGAPTVLRGLRDRVEALGGGLEVRGDLATGTTVVVELPARRRIAAQA